MKLDELIKTLPNRDEGGLRDRYVGWGPFEDYLWNEGDGLESLKEFETWEDFYREMKGCDPDYNQVFDFYFLVTHDSKSCEACDRTGYNPETKEIADDFYAFGDGGRKVKLLEQGKIREMLLAPNIPPDRSRRWVDRITPDEAAALRREERLREKTHDWIEGKWVKKDPQPTDEELAAICNHANSPGVMDGGLGHDAINRWILVETRAKRLGVWGRCEECAGEGDIRLSEDYLALNLWLGYPRKGASRGIHIKRVPPEKFDEIQGFLAASHDRHMDCFRWIYDGKDE